ncbi:hypothetical protein V9L05_24100 (plasmid) [Bernardetia sp. Wsw4-3y2]
MIYCITGISYAQSDSTIVTDPNLKENLSYRKQGIIDSLNDKLAKKPYVYVSPYYFRVYNSDKEYMALQLGKRKRNKIFLYIKVFSHNVCIRDGKVVEFIFEDGSIKSLKKNKYPVNCDGIIVMRLRRKQRKMLTEGKIKSFMIFTFQKDYTFHITEKAAQSIQNDIILLKNYKF